MTTNTNDIATATAKPKKPKKRKLLHKFFEVERHRESKLFEFMMGPEYDTASAIDDLLWLKSPPPYKRLATEFLDSLDSFGEYCLEVSMTDKSSPEEIRRAKEYYRKNKEKIKRENEKKKKDAAARKKKEILAKSDRTPVTAKKKRRNRKSLNHTNEIDFSSGAKKAVKELFPTKNFRVVKPFTINEELTASVYDLVTEDAFGIWTLNEKSGNQTRFTIDGNRIKYFIKNDRDFGIADLGGI